MWIIKESLLEFKLTYFGERLFGNTIFKSICKSFREMAKCFIDLIKSKFQKTDFKNIF